MNNYYIKNEEILKQVEEWKETGKMPEELGTTFMLISRNLANRRNFIGYTWKEDMISEGVLSCVKYFRSFNTEKSTNAHAYISKICYHAFVTYIKKQNRHGKTKQTLYDQKNDIDQESFVSYKSIDYTELARNETDENTGS